MVSHRISDILDSALLILTSHPEDRAFKSIKTIRLREATIQEIFLLMRHQVEPKYITYTAAFFYLLILNDDSGIDRFKLRDIMGHLIQIHEEVDPIKMQQSASRAPLKEYRLD